MKEFLINKKSIFLIVIFFILIVQVIFFIRKSYSYQTLYDILPENSIIVGEKIFEGEVNPNYIAQNAINYYIKTNDENVKIYKYSGLDKNNKPIWGTYSDETNSYIEISEEELIKLEKILKEEYNLE